MTGTVLIVDDSLTVRMDLADAFEAAGLHALPCATAAQARAALGDEQVVLAILDVVLPDGDGIELLKEIRATTTTSPFVLMLSSEAEVKNRIRGLEIGADDYVGKPYDTGYVVARAKELLRRRPDAGTSGKATILVIDDSPTFRSEVTGALETSGYAVISASSGEEGLRIAANSRPAAIIVDGVMGGIDGATVIRTIRLDSALRRTPCLLLTGSEESSSELDALDAGADAFVRKEENLQVILARLAATLRNAHAESHNGVSLLGPKRILAVDDSATYLEELSAALRSEGYDVVLARSGEEALDMLAAQSVDCVLLDLMMPGMGGKEACLRIKASPVARDIPLIILTGLEDRDAMIDGLTLGADDYIQKSGEFGLLKARVRAQMRRRQFEDEHRKVREDLLRSQLEATKARAAQQISEARAALVGELERKNQELEAFSYSVSHDLRAPLRSIDGFGLALLEEYADKLDETGRDYLRRVRASTQRMGELIDDLLQLSRVSRGQIHRQRVNLSELARSVGRELEHANPERGVQFEVEEGMSIHADGRLIRVLLENLLGNAWKFTAKVATARIEVGATAGDGNAVYFVKDNGAGFDMTHVKRLFNPFQRLHTEADYPGTGIGLATVHRIVDRHGGRVWATSAIGVGTTIHFVIPPPPAVRA